MKKNLGIQKRPAIFISGAATGIGRACAERFAQQGWFVGLYDIQSDEVRKTAESLNTEHYAFGYLDVTDPDSWKVVLEEFWQKSQHRLDVLFNNAGVLSTGAFETVPLNKHHQMVAVNLVGMMNGCHTAFSYLKQTVNAQVINMASATAIYGQPDLVTYSATKFAVRGFTEGLEIEWKNQGIHVHDIWPSFVKTRMSESFKHISSANSLGIQLSAENVADTVWRCANTKLFRHRTHWMVGFQAKILAIATSLAPSFMSKWVVRKIAH